MMPMINVIIGMGVVGIIWITLNILLGEEE